MFEKTKEIYLPIGNSCKVAWYLNNNQFREEAYPFDWTVTPINSAITLLNNNFQDFFEISNLFFLQPTPRLLFTDDDKCPKLTNDIITPVFDTKYKILYVHDFSIKGKAEFENVKQKYMKRVDRVRNMWNSKSSKIFCIYDESELNEWQTSQYQKVDYIFKHQEELLTLNRENTIVISLENFKKMKGI